MLLLQNSLLAVVNTHEGNILVDQSTTMNVTDFIRTIFPNFGPAQINGAAMMYQNMGSNVDQANLVMGECAYVLWLTRPAPDFMSGFSNVRLSYLLYTQSFRRKSMEGKLEVSRNYVCLTEAGRVCNSTWPACT
jgi:hypothetical protein